MSLTLQTVDRYLDNSNVKRMLDLLGYTEGTDKLHGYHTLVGGRRIQDLSKHPNIVGLVTKNGPSTAFGRYQITFPTFQEFAKKLGITDVSPRNQDRIAVAIMASQGALGDIAKGDFGSGIQKLGTRWASLPSSKYGQPTKSWADISKKLADKSLPNIEHSIYNDGIWKNARNAIRLAESTIPIPDFFNTFNPSITINKLFHNTANSYQPKEISLLGLGFNPIGKTRGMVSDIFPVVNEKANKLFG